MSDVATPPPEIAPEAGHWTERHGKPLVFVILGVVATGIYLATAIPAAVFPHTDFPRIVVGVDNGVTPIDQMLVTVTRPIEQALNTVHGLDNMWSVTSRGSAEIDLFFTWKTDMFRALTLVNAALAGVQPELPSTARVTATRLTFAAFPVMGYSLTSETVPQTRLWELANYDLKFRLNRLLGVASVVAQGGQQPDFRITPDPAKLAQTGVTVPNILDAIARSNLVDSPGLIDRRHQLYLALVTGQTRDPQQIASVVIKLAPGGTPVRIGDVATVEPAVVPVYTIVTADGRPAVLLNIFRQPDSNTVQVADAVHSEIDQIRRTLPPGIVLQSYYDQSGLVRDSIKSVRDAILIGLFLACLIMVLFLRDPGTSLVAGLVIPATIAVTFIFLRLAGETFNLMTLGGLAAAVGLVIDDAIVVVENIVLHRDAGESRSAAIRKALSEIRKPLIGSTITPIVVFLPLVAIAGVTGVFFGALAITVAIALLTSLVLALTWTPALSHYFLRPRPERAARFTEALPGWVMRHYERLLRAVLEHPGLLAVLAAAAISVSYVCYRHLGSDLLPAIDEGAFVIDYIMPAGASLQETNRVITHIEDILRTLPEVQATSRRTGLQLGLAAVTEANTGDIMVKLKHKRDKSTEEMIEEVRKKITQAEPTVDVEFTEVLQDMIGDLTSAPEPVVIKLFSPDPALLNNWAPKVADKIKTIPGVVDVLNGIENTISGPAIVFTVDPVVAAKAGFTAQEVQVDTSAVLQGEPAPTPAVVSDRAYPIRVRFPESARADLESIKNTLLVSATGKTATLGSLATITELPGQNEIREENLLRDVQVTARFEGMSLGTGMAKVRAAVASLHIPTTVRVAYGGQFQEQQQSFRELVLVLVVAVVLVFTVLLLEFGDFAAPIAVICSALLSSSGVFVALLITGRTFNLSSFMGLIMVIGIVAKNGILLLDADRGFRAAGIAPEWSMLHAGERRLRPILMTALATVAGMIPLALALGPGSEMLQPLAIAVIGGVLASCLLSLVITPAVHYLIGGGG